MATADKVAKGIPENIQQEQQQAQQQRQAAASAPAQSEPAPQGEAGGDEGGNVNLFDLAAQRGGSGRSGGGGGGGNQAASAAAAAAAMAGGQGGGDLGNLDFLRNNAQFQQLRQVVQQQPQMLEPILQQLGAGNPQLAQLIANHPDQFLQLLGEDGDDDVPLPPGAQAISVTEEERDAIERVCTLYPILGRCVTLTILDSYAALGSTVIRRSRLTLRATKTRSWLPTSSSTSPMMTTNPPRIKLPRRPM